MSADRSEGILVVFGIDDYQMVLMSDIRYPCIHQLHDIARVGGHVDALVLYSDK